MKDFKGHSHQKFGHFTFSQHGEDLMFMNLARLIGLDKPSYIDLGAHHPIYISNTALLYQNGSRGINVEANPFFMNDFKKYRPDEINVCVGVGVTPGQTKFYMVDDECVLNSFDLKNLAHHKVKPNKTIDVNIMTLNQIIDQFSNKKFPDILLTDVEGFDWDIISSANFTISRPKIICSELDSDRQYNLSGYKVLCRIISNVIFIAEEHYGKCI